MYRHRGNTAAKPRRHRLPAPAKRAQYIAESIQMRVAEGRDWTFADYGIAQNPEMVDLVKAALGVEP